MNRRILTPLAAIGVTLATASAAQAHTPNVTVSPKCDTDGNGYVQIHMQNFPTPPSKVAVQINTDDHPAVAVGMWKLNKDGDDLFPASGPDTPRSYTVRLGNNAQHTVRVWLRWFADGGGTYDHTFPVDCGQPKSTPPQIVYIDRPGPVQTIEKTNTVYVQVPAPPRQAECKAYSKTLLVTVGRKDGHHGPVMTRVNVYVDNVLQGRTTGAKRETKRIPLVGIPCGTHKIRVTASIINNGRHFTKTKRARLTASGLGVQPVSLARL